MFSQFTAKPIEVIGEIAKKAETLGYTVTTLPGNCVPVMSSNSLGGHSVTSYSFSSSYAYQLTNPFDIKYTSNCTASLNKNSTNVHWQITFPIDIPIKGMAFTNSVDPRYSSTGDNITLTVFIDDTEIKSVTFDSEWDLGERRCVMFDDEVVGKVAKMVFTTTSESTIYLYPHRIEVLSTKTPAYLLQSTGESGLDNVNLMLELGNYNNISYIDTSKVGNFISLVPLEDVDLESGVIKGMSMYYNKHVIYTGGTTTYTEGLREIEVILSITKDRVVLCTKGNSMNSTVTTTTSYVGLPIRFSNEPDSSAILRGSTSWSEWSGASTVMRNQLGQQFFRLDSRWITSSVAPTSWGDKVFLSPAFLDAPQEGMRGELDGVKFVTNSGIVHGDEVTVGSTKYFVTINATEGYNSFPTVAILIDKSK